MRVQPRIGFVVADVLLEWMIRDEVIMWLLPICQTLRRRDGLLQDRS